MNAFYAAGYRDGHSDGRVDGRVSTRAEILGDLTSMKRALEERLAAIPRTEHDSISGDVRIELELVSKLMKAWF